VRKYYPENSVNFIRLQSKVSYSKQEEI